MKKQTGLFFRLSFVACCFLTIGFAQPVKVRVTTSTEEFKLKMYDNKVGIFGNEKEGFAFLGLVGKGIVLDGYDKSLNPIYNKDIPFETKSLYDRPLGVVHLAGKHYFLHSGFDKGSAESFVYSSEIDVKNGNVSQATSPLITTGQITEIESSFYKFYARRSDRYYVSGTPDEKYLSIVYLLKPEREHGEFSSIDIGVHVYEAGMKAKLEKKFTLPNENGSNAVIIAGTIVTKEGDVYILVTHESRNKVEAIEIVKVPADGGKPLIQEVILPGTRSIMGTNFVLTQKGICIGGVCAASETGQLMFYTYTHDGKNGDFMTYPLADPNNIEAETKRRKSYPLRLSEVVADEDGSVLISLEERKSSTTRGTSVSNTRFEYRNIYCTKINPEGKQLWYKKVSKFQEALNFTGALGMKMLTAKNCMVGLFNDNEKNEDLEENDKAKPMIVGHSSVVFSSVVVDNNGKLTKLSQDLGKTFVHTFMLYKFSETGYIGITQVGNRSYSPIRIDLK